jgi:hypothetical protein
LHGVEGACIKGAGEKGRRRSVAKYDYDAGAAPQMDSRLWRRQAPAAEQQNNGAAAEKRARVLDFRLTLFWNPLGLRALDALVLGASETGRVNGDARVRVAFQLHQLVHARDLGAEFI